ncbi:hypothetical protein EJ08DRAFT_649491 [Tothia fuscella]|uniref:Uncharacterized protein n=1 Tax=Tothia fuscella TaxID=1048955 RepID=A0A9P4NRD2_9PEZI|nr:hypothetical protein EJ08DRAFT_649491 [Tothia fuscella]
MSSASSDTGTKSKENAPFSKRAVRPNPLLKGRDEVRERRRGLFMKKVELGRGEKRWEGRSDKILRSDYLSQQRRWEAERALAAPESFPEYLDDEGEENTETIEHGFPMDAQQIDYANIMHATPSLRPQTRKPRVFSNPTVEDAEVDEVARREEMELQELIRLADEPHGDVGMEMWIEEDVGIDIGIPSSPSRYGSDEDDYDDIFMEILSSQEGRQGGSHQQQQQSNPFAQREDDGMDLSNG